MLKNLLLLLFSVTLVLGAVEGVLRYKKDALPLDFIGRVDTEVSPRGYALNPNTGSAQPHLQINVTYHFYPPHLRDTPLDSKATKILVLGDSYTFGALLPWEHTAIHLLQKSADQVFGSNKYQFANAATGGWGTSDYLAYLEEFGPQIAPKYVLVFLNTDDIGRSIYHSVYKLADTNSLKLAENFHQLQFDGLLANAQLSTKGKYLELFKEWLYHNWVFQHSMLLHLIRHEVVALAHVVFRSTYAEYDNEVQTIKIDIPASNGLAFEDKDAIRLGKALFLRINEWCNQHGAKLIVVTTGYNAFYPEKLRDPTKTFLSIAPNFFAEEHIAYYDIASQFKIAAEKAESQGKSFVFPVDYHPSKYGAQAIAEFSWPAIRQQLMNGYVSPTKAT